VQCNVAWLLVCLLCFIRKDRLIAPCPSVSLIIIYRDELQHVGNFQDWICTVQVYCHDIEASPLHLTHM